MPKEKDSDINFDQRSMRFQRNIYRSAKGKIRLAVLARDFADYLPSNSVMDGARVLDAGAGQGHFALTLARQGLQLTLCDHSKDMLQEAALRFTQAGLQAELIHSRFQDHIENENRQFDIVLCHALAEWLENPESVFQLLKVLKPGGIFSLIFYNFHGLEFKNLLRTNFKRFDANNFKAWRGSLTPTHPLKPEEVLMWAETHKLQLLTHSGIRVFHDYIFSREDREREPEVLLDKELFYSNQEPYWKLGRYIHFLFSKPNI